MDFLSEGGWMDAEGGRVFLGGGEVEFLSLSRGGFSLREGDFGSFIKCFYITK